MSSTGQRRKKEWNSYLTDDEKFRLSKQEILEKKKLLVSKNSMYSEKSKFVNTPSSQLKKSANDSKSRYASSREINFTQKDFASPSPFTINSSSQATTTHSEDSDNDFIDLASISNQNDGNDNNSIGNDGSNRWKKTFTSSNLLVETPTKKDGAIKFNVKINPPKNSKRLNSKQKKSSPSNDDSPYLANDNIQSDNFQYENIFHRPKNVANSKITDNIVPLKHETLDDDTYRDIAAEIDVLRTELRYYEEISGRSSILNSKQLDAVWDAAVDSSELNHKTVLKYLVELVCQTMSYLLKSEVELQNQKSQFETLSTRMDSLAAVVGTLSLDATKFNQASIIDDSAVSVNVMDNEAKEHADNAVDNAVKSDVDELPWATPVTKNHTNNFSTPSPRVVPSTEHIPIRLFHSPVLRTDSEPPLEQRLHPQQQPMSPSSTLQSQLDSLLSVHHRVSSPSTAVADTSRLQYSSVTPSTATRFTPAAASALPQQPLSEHSSSLQSTAHFHFSGTSASDWLFSPPPPPPPLPSSSSASSQHPPHYSSSFTSPSYIIKEPPHLALFSAATTSESNSSIRSSPLATAAVGSSSWSSPTISSPQFSQAHHPPTESLRKNLFPEHSHSSPLSHKTFSGPLPLNTEQHSIISPHPPHLPTPQSAPQHPLSADMSVLQALLRSPDNNNNNHNSLNRIFDARLGSF